MLPTPSTDHIGSNIYAPAEDSYLVLDTLSSAPEKHFLTSRFAAPSKTPLVVETGTGSGVILAFITANARTILGRNDVLTSGTDVSVFACHAAQETVLRHRNQVIQTDAEEAGQLLDCINGDLASSLQPRTVDLLVFNPPYVPSDAVPPLNNLANGTAFERDSTLLALATDGGIDGMEVTERLLENLGKILSYRGVAYVLFAKRNRPEQVIDRMRKQEDGQKWRAEIVKESGRTGGFEKLCVARISRDVSNDSNVAD